MQVSADKSLGLRTNLRFLYISISLGAPCSCWLRLKIWAFG